MIADDDPFARRVIKEALTEAGVMIVAEARNGRQAVEFALYYRPDVVILDLVMRELDGILATRQILKMVPDQLVIVLTGVDDDDGTVPATLARSQCAASDVDRMVRVSLRTVTLSIPPQDIITRDNVTAHVDAVTYFRYLEGEVRWTCCSERYERSAGCRD